MFKTKRRKKNNKDKKKILVKRNLSLRMVKKEMS